MIGLEPRKQRRSGVSNRSELAVNAHCIKDGVSFREPPLSPSNMAEVAQGRGIS